MQYPLLQMVAKEIPVSQYGVVMSGFLRDILIDRGIKKEDLPKTKRELFKMVTGKDYKDKNNA